MPRTFARVSPVVALCAVFQRRTGKGAQAEETAAVPRCAKNCDCCVFCRSWRIGCQALEGRKMSRRKARGCYSLPCRTTAPGNADGARGSSFSRTPSFRGCKPQHYEKPGLQYQEAQNTPCIFRGCNHLPSLAGASRACGCPPAAADRSGQQPDPTFIAANTINFKLKTIRSNRHETTTYDA